MTSVALLVAGPASSAHARAATAPDLVHTDAWWVPPAGGDGDSAAALDGPIANAGIRRSSRFQAKLDGVPVAPQPRAGVNVTPQATGCAVERTTDDIADERTTLPRYKVVYTYPTDVGDRYAMYRNLL